ncbi:hypothetical protein Tco_1036799 [Tanacetum coccineum]
MTLEVVYPAVHKIKAESTAIQVEAKQSITEEEYLLEMSFNLVNMIKLLYQSCIRVTHSSRSYRSSDHRRSRCHSLEYDRREGREVSRRYTDDKDYRDRSEPSPRQGRDNRDYDIKRSRYQSSRTPGIAHLQIGGYFGRNNVS